MKKLLSLLHAGGQGRRVPAYAPSGKILTPIPVFRWERKTAPRYSGGRFFYLLVPFLRKWHYAFQGILRQGAEE